MCVRMFGYNFFTLETLYDEAMLQLGKEKKFAKQLGHKYIGFDPNS